MRALLITVATVAVASLWRSVPAHTAGVAPSAGAPSSEVAPPSAGAPSSEVAPPSAGAPSAAAAPAANGSLRRANAGDPARNEGPAAPMGLGQLVPTSPKAREAAPPSGPEVDGQLWRYMFKVRQRPDLPPAVTGEDLQKQVDAALKRYFDSLVRAAYMKLTAQLLKKAFAAIKPELSDCLGKIMLRSARQLLHEPFSLPRTVQLSAKERRVARKIQAKVRARILSAARPFVASTLKKRLADQQAPTAQATLSEVANLLRNAEAAVRQEAAAPLPATDKELRARTEAELWAQLRSQIEPQMQTQTQKEGHQHFSTNGARLLRTAAEATAPRCELEPDGWRVQLVWMSTPSTEITDDPVESDRVKRIASTLVHQHLAQAPVLVSGLVWNLPTVFSPRCLDLQGRFPTVRRADTVAFLSGRFDAEGDPAAPLMADLFLVTTDPAALWVSERGLKRLYPETKHFLNVLVFFTDAEASAAAAAEQLDAENALRLQRDGCLASVPTPAHMGAVLNAKNIAFLGFVSKRVRASWEQRLKEMNVLGELGDLPLDKNRTLADGFGPVLLDSIRRLVCQAQKRLKRRTRNKPRDNTEAAARARGF